MLVWVSTAAQGDLICFASALPDDFPKILQRHVGGGGVEAVLIALHPRLHTQAGLSVDTVAHDAHIQKLREGGHERVLFGLRSILEYAGPDIPACRLIKDGYKILVFPYAHTGNHPRLNNPNHPQLL